MSVTGMPVRSSAPTARRGSPPGWSPPRSTGSRLWARWWGEDRVGSANDSGGTRHPEPTTIEFHGCARRIVGELEAVVAAEIVEALPGDELLAGAGGQQQVLVGELAEHPVPFRPGPGRDRVRVGPCGRMQEQGPVAVD